MSISEIKLSVESMALPELGREIEKHYKKSEELEAKTRSGGGLSAEDSAHLIETLNLIDSLEAVLSRKQSDEQNITRMREKLAQRKPATPMVHGEPTREASGERRRERKTIGQQFAESPEYRAQFPAGHVYSQNMVPRVGITFDYNHREQRALLQGADANSGGALVVNDRIPTIVDIRQRQLTFLDLVTRLKTDSDTIEWPKETTFTNNAAAVAEATATTGTSGLKPETALAFVNVTSPVQTVAHWVPVTTRMLADYSGIRGYIDARLMLGLDLALETALLSGNGSSPNLDGLTHLSGVQTRALGSDSAIDAIFKLMTMVQVTGLAIPNAVVMNPADFEAIRLSRENASTGTLGQYLYGPPSVAGPMTLWGRPLVESIGLTEGTALVGDFSANSMILWDREMATVRTGYVDDQFIRNLLTVLAELRVAFTVFRESAVAKITGI